MKEIVDSLEGLPWIVRLILTVFAGAYSNLLRLFKSIAANNVLGIVLSVILLLTGGLGIVWIIDVVMVAMKKDIWWFC